MRTHLPAGHWSIDLTRDVRTPHVCPLEGGASGYSMEMQRAGRWPPPAPVFQLTGSPQDYSLFRRWLRHIWLECDAGIGVNTLTEADAGIGKSALFIGMLVLDQPAPSISHAFVYKTQALVDQIRDASTPNESLFGDEALTNMVWGLGIHDELQQELYRTIWEMARRNRKKIHFAVQDSKSASRIARSGICRYWIVLEKRNVRTGRKRGLLLHGVRSPKYDKKARGYEMERPFRYRMLGRFTAPGVGADALEKYDAARARGLEEEERIDYDITG